MPELQNIREGGHVEHDVSDVPLQHEGFDPAYGVLFAVLALAAIALRWVWKR